MSGIPTETFEFLDELSLNNNKTWFDAHKKEYEANLVEPLQEFIASLGGRLQQKYPDAVYDTRTNGQGTLSRIYRDIRFSKDKTPYRTHLWGMFAPKSAHQEGRPGFGFSVAPEGLHLMAGIWMFPKEKLAAFRDAVVDPQRGAALDKAIAALRKNSLTVSGEHYKKVPAGYDSSHPRAKLLLHEGLYTYTDPMPPAEAAEPDLVDRVMDRYAQMAPLNRWLASFGA
jgi:uncharacterized protein (TIGR02453 family)